jgi:hypothetical protein
MGAVNMATKTLIVLYGLDACWHKHAQKLPSLGGGGGGKVYYQEE